MDNDGTIRELAGLVSRAKTFRENGHVLVSAAEWDRMVGVAMQVNELVGPPEGLFPVEPVSPVDGVQKMVNRLTKNPWEREKLPKIWQYFCERTGKNSLYMPTEKRIKAGLERMKDLMEWGKGDTKKVLKAWKIAIDNLADDKFMAGENDRQKVYQDWLKHLCCSWEVFERRLLA